MNGKSGWLAAFVVAAGAAATLWGCVAARQEAGAAAPAAAPAEERAAAPAAEARPEGTWPNAAEVYAKGVPQLTTAQCGQCHYAIFSTIREEGGRHQLHCRFCHETFHSYKPGKAWEDVVPRCSTCHQGIHDPSFTQCTACHRQAHAPIASLVGVDALEPNCPTCHTDPASQLQQHPSAHTDEGCASCHHDTHGYIPDCVECHDEPHTPYVDRAGCTQCHPVHAPLQVAYAESVPNEICGGCHGAEYDQLRSGTKKHASFQCAFCHSERHGNVPRCEDCHGRPHSEALLRRFESCGACHGNPHLLEWVYSVPKQ
ncbi:MAG: cytochrome c [Deferrisomatales bacterium]